MSFVGTFGTFTTARLGIYVAQKGLSVTGNNISNINTTGYTRQALDQVSLKTGGGDRYRSQFDVHVGTGVLATGVSQLRDPYLDIRYRTEMSSVGAMETKLSGLKDLSAILDEVGDGTDGFGVLEAELNKFVDSLERLDVSAGEQSFDSLARASASSLASLFNTYSKKLEQLEKNTMNGFQQDLNRVNEILNNIRDLNSRIRKSEIHGDNSLEMRDERNLLIDELSKYMKIDVRYSMEDIGAGQLVEKLTIKLGNANPDSTVDTDSATLVDGVYAVQMQMPQTIPQLNPKYDPALPDQDPNHLMYLDQNGNPVEKAEQAAQVENTTYNLSLTKLLDSKGREWKEVKAPVETMLGGKPADTTTTEKDDGKGTITKTTYEERTNDAGGKDWYAITTTTLYTQEIDLDDNDLYGSLQATRELLTESGEFSTIGTINGMDENAAVKRGIPYYRKSLDLLARQFATQFNQANQGYMVDEKGNYLTDAGEIVMLEGDALNKYSLTTAQQNYLTGQKITAEEYLDQKGVTKVGGNLFSIRGDTDDGEGITAANLSVSQSWATGAVHIVTTFIKPFGDLSNSTQGSNLDHMVSLMDKPLDYNPQDLVEDAKSSHLFSGSFQEMFDKMNTVLGNDISTTTIQLNTYSEAAVELDSSRDGVSGVDLNDEAMNLMQYSKSYSAACRLMTTLDEALDRLINNTGIVGR